MAFAHCPAQSWPGCGARAPRLRYFALHNRSTSGICPMQLDLSTGFDAERSDDATGNARQRDRKTDFGTKGTLQFGVNIG